MISHQPGNDFFEYWDSLGFFGNIQVILPIEFMLLFEIARALFTERASADALNAIEEISSDNTVFIPDREKSIFVNRMEKHVPLGNNMEIEPIRKMTDLKKALPRELAHDDEVFNAKLFTRTLMVRRFYESETDTYKPVSTIKNESGREANKFEQIFYILLDTSRSMDMHMRSFYSKCIVAEFLRRKKDTGAKLFFRTFDSKVGKLYRIEKREDFPFLIEHVLLSTTGGVSTNLQKAVFQAVDDIRFSKDMLNSEILVVTDGVSTIDPDEMADKLGDIKLHVLKVGEEMPEPDFYEMKLALAAENIDFDPSSINFKVIKEHLSENAGDNSAKSKSYQKVLRIMMDQSEKMVGDLRRISRKYIQFGYINSDRLFDISYENIENIFHLIKQLESAKIKYMDIDGKTKIFRQVFFLGQYVKMLLQNSDKNSAELKSFLRRIEMIKSKFMEDRELFLFIVRAGNYHEDKKKLKIDRKEARKLMKNMKLENKKLSLKEMRKAQLTFTFESGEEGSGGKLFLLLLIKLYEAAGRALAYPFNRFRKTKDKEDDGDENKKEDE